MKRISARGLSILNTVSGKKGTTSFSTVTLAFLGDFYNFYTNENRSENAIIMCNLLT